MFTSVDNFVGDLPPTGLSHNKAKSGALLPSNVSPELREFVKERGVTIYYGSMPALGAMVGWSPDGIAKWVKDKMVRTHTPFFEAISHKALPAQHALALLRLCMLPRMNFWTRVLPPDVVAPAAKAFDDLVLETALRKLGLGTSLSNVAQKNH